MDSTLEHSLTQAIEEHFAHNPQAADTATGVARCWLPARGVQASVSEVEQVLAAMVQRQALRCVLLADGAVLYSKNRAEWR